MKSIVHFSSSISTVILWIALTSNCFIQAQLQNEKNAATTSENTLITGPAHNNAEIQFMDLKKDEFLPLADNVTATIAKYLTEYCQSKSDCGTSKRFTENDIGFYGKTLKDKLVENGRFVIAKIYAKTESSSHITGATILGQPEISEDSLNVLPKQTMEDFMINYRDQIVEETKIPIAYVNNKNVYPQRDNLDNYLIVSISCTFCVILIIFNLICQRRIEKRAKKDFLAQVKTPKRTVIKSLPKELLENERRLNDETTGQEQEQTKPLLVKPLAQMPQQQQQQPQQQQQLQQPLQPSSSAYLSPKLIDTPQRELTETSINLAVPNVISRHASFDLRSDPLSRPSNSSKRRKRRSRSNQSPIAGNMGSGIGSPREIAMEDVDPNSNMRIMSAAIYQHQHQPMQTSHMKSSISNDSFRRVHQRPHKRIQRRSQYRQHTFSEDDLNEIQIPIECVDRRNHASRMINANDYADSRVAYRLAVSEQL